MKHPQARPPANRPPLAYPPIVVTTTAARNAVASRAPGPGGLAPSTLALGTLAVAATLAAALALVAPPVQAAQAAAPTSAAPTAAAPTANEPAYVDAAEAAARDWLRKLDTDDFGATWDSAAASFRKAITRDKWAADVGAVRKAVGALQERNNRGARFTRSLPGAPDGDYVLIQNDARFQNKSAAIETITMAREADGVWRLAGYFVR